MANCYLHILKEARKPGTKLLDRAERAHLVGYDSPSVMRLYVPSRNTVTTATLSHVRFVPPGKRVHWDIEDMPPSAPNDNAPPSSSGVNNDTDSSSPDATPPSSSTSGNDNPEPGANKRSASTDVNVGGVPPLGGVSPRNNRRLPATPPRLLTSRRNRNSPAPASPSSASQQNPRTSQRSRLNPQTQPRPPPSNGGSANRGAKTQTKTKTAPSTSRKPNLTRSGTQSGKTYLKDFSNVAGCEDSDDDKTAVHAAAMITINDDIPTTLQQALKSRESA
ncbi:hypothetical protein V8C44DRAFT_42261 [Trichoderma aethiopicum]